jgi:hypothetical protein
MFGFIKAIIKIKLLFLAITVIAVLLVLALKRCSYCRNLMKAKD